MHLYLAVSQKFNRHQTEAIARTLPPNQLFSYAYASYEKTLAPIWEHAHAMHLHFAGIVTYQPDRIYQELPKRLDSFAYPHEAEKYAKSAPRGARLLVDSGAFTAHSTGKVFTPAQYAAWSEEFKWRWEAKSNRIDFFNLDVIGDQDASWKNQAELERLGMKPIPIITYGANIKHLEHALANYPWIALGGLVPHARDKKRLVGWLDSCFRLVVARYKETGTMPRIHLLGLTQAWALERYPVYSCDSSSWVSVLRYGGADAIGRKGHRFPKASQEPEVNLYALRQEVRRYQALEVKATALWARRGIVFED